MYKESPSGNLDIAKDQEPRILSLPQQSPTYTSKIEINTIYKFSIKTFIYKSTQFCRCKNSCTVDIDDINDFKYADFLFQTTVIKKTCGLA